MFQVPTKIIVIFLQNKAKKKNMLTVIYSKKKNKGSFLNIPYRFEFKFTLKTP